MIDIVLINAFGTVIVIAECFGNIDIGFDSIVNLTMNFAVRNLIIVNADIDRLHISIHDAHVVISIVIVIIVTVIVVNV